MSDAREKGHEEEERDCSKELVTKGRKKICSKAYDVWSVTVPGFSCFPHCLLLLRAVESSTSPVPRGGETAEQAGHRLLGAMLVPMGVSSAVQLQGS